MNRRNLEKQRGLENNSLENSMRLLLNLKIYGEKLGEDAEERYNELEIKKKLVKKCLEYKDGLEAKKLCEEILEQEEDVETLANLGIAYYYLGNIQKAFEYCKEVIRLGQKQQIDFKALSRAYTGIGLAYERIEDFDKAVIAFKKAISLDENNMLASRSFSCLQRYGNKTWGIAKTIELEDGSRTVGWWHYKDPGIEKINNAENILGI